MPPTNACTTEFGDRNSVKAAVKSLGRNSTQRAKFERAIECFKQGKSNAVNVAASNAASTAAASANKAANANATAAAAAAVNAAKLKSNVNASTLRNAANSASKNLVAAKANVVAANASVNAAKKAASTFKNVNNVLLRGNVLAKNGTFKTRGSKFPKAKNLGAALTAKNASWRRARNSKTQVRNVLLEHTNWWN